MKKKILSAVLALFMIAQTVTFITVSAFSAEETCAHANYEQYGDPVAPTCTEWGFTILRCSDCQDHFKTVMNADDPPCIETEGMKWINIMVVVPTCVADGYETQTCSICQKEYKYNIVPKSDSYHSWGEWVKTDSTCTENGIRSRSCEFCGKVISEAISAKGHSWVAQLDKVVEPKCADYVDPADPDNAKAAYGSVPFACEDCDAIITLDVKPLDYHIFVQMEKDTSGACGSVYLEESGDYCKFCYVDVNGNEHGVIRHDWVEVEGGERKDPTCTEAGYMTVRCTKCKIAEKKELLMESHDFATECLPATCTEDGYLYEKCLKCGKETTCVLEAPGHDWVETGVKVVPTCTTPMGYEYICNNGCGMRKIVPDPYSSALGHSQQLEEIPELAPTCDLNGFTAGKRCYNCMEYVEGHETLPPLGHDVQTTVCTVACKEYTECARCGYVYGVSDQTPTDPFPGDDLPFVGEDDVLSYSVAETAESHSFVKVDANSVEPTCTAAGINALECRFCGKTATEDVPATGHKTKISKIMPTCTSSGYEIVTCSICKASISQTVLPIDPNGHFGTVIDSVYPTCTTDGLEVCRCTYCGKSFEKVYTKLGHDTVNIPGREPTCTEAGNTEGSYCGRCGETFKRSEPLKALGHDEIVIKGVAPTCTENGLTDGRICGRCNSTLSRQVAISKLDHCSYGVRYAKEEVYSANCNTVGFTVHWCEYCDDGYVDSFLYKMDHAWSDLMHKAVNCIEDGYDYYACTVKGCNAIKEVANSRVPAEGHKDKDGNVISTSCSRPENTDAVCVNKFCPDIDKVIDATHNYKSAGDVDDGCGACSHILYVCDDCGAQREVKTPHNYKIIYQDEFTPTFEKAQKVIEECSVCGETKEYYNAKNTQLKVTSSYSGKMIAAGAKNVRFDIAVRGDKRGINSITGRFIYNKELFEFAGAECSETLAGASVSVEASSPAAGIVDTTLKVADDESGKVIDAILSGEFETFVTLVFNVNDDISFRDGVVSYLSSCGFSKITVNNANGAAIGAETTLATVDVKIYRRGDLNMDGSITNADALGIFKYIYNPKLYPLDVNGLTDVDGNGDINNADALRILKYIYDPERYPLVP